MSGRPLRSERARRRNLRDLERAGLSPWAHFFKRCRWANGGFDGIATFDYVRLRGPRSAAPHVQCEMTYAVLRASGRIRGRSGPVLYVTADIAEGFYSDLARCCEINRLGKWAEPAIVPLLNWRISFGDREQLRALTHAAQSAKVRSIVVERSVTPERSYIAGRCYATLLQAYTGAHVFWADSFRLPPLLDSIAGNP